MRRKWTALLLALTLLVSGAQAMTRDEMRARYDAARACRSGETPYLEEASVQNFTAGALSEDAQNAALEQLNFLRALAGLEEVRLNALYTLRCQNAALLLAANDRLSHAPEQPQGMPDALYQSGSLGAASSDIARFNWMRPDILIDGVNYFARDDGDGNLPVLGHRRWLLNPLMHETGFGLANARSGASYVSMYAVDAQGDADWRYVAWPSAGAFPAEMMAADLAWSVSLNDAFYDLDASEPRAELTELGSGVCFYFDFVNESGDGYCRVSREAYGAGPCLILRPDLAAAGIEGYAQNQRWQLRLTGLKTADGADASIEYICDMASLYPQTVAGVELSQTQAELRIGEVLALSADVIPEYADDLALSWASSDPSVAAVDESGRVRAASAGECVISAFSANGRYDECRVTVHE